jgi:hypothetical protein
MKFPATQTIRSIKKETLHLWTAFAFYSAIFLIFFSPVIFGAKLFPSDGQLPTFYAPLALWDNLLWSGFPIAADGTWQMWYPLRHIFRLLPMGWDFNCYILSVYVLSSTFTCGYVYTLTRSWLAGAAAGIVFGMSGFMMAHLGQTSVIHTAMWYPLIMWAMEKLRHRCSALWICIGAVAVGNCILGSHFQIALYSMVFSFLYAVIVGRNSSFKRGRYMASLCLVFFLGVGISAVLLLPAMEFSALSDRAKMSFGTFVSHSLPLKQIFQIFFPYLFGGAYPSIYGGTYFGSYSKEELTGYVGLLPWILAFTSLFSAQYRRLCLFFSAVIIFSILASLGDATPLANILYHVPFVNKFRAPVRHLLEMNFAISVLTGLGIYLVQSKRIVFAQMIRASSLFFLVTMIALICIYLLYPEYEVLAKKLNMNLPTIVFNRAIGIPLIILFCSYVSLFYWYGSTSSLLRQGLILIVVALNMCSSAWFNEWRPAAPGQYLLEKPDYALNLKAQLDQSRQRFTHIDGYASALFPPNYSKLWEVPSAGGYGPLVLKRYKDLSGIQEHGTLLDSSFLNPDNRSFDILAIRYVSTVRSRGAVGSDGFLRGSDDLFTDRDRWRPVAHLGNTAIYENLHALPRAWLVSETISARGDEILKAIQSSLLPDGRKFRPERMALVEEVLSFSLERENPNSSLEIVQLSDMDIQLRTNGSHSQFLVMSDIYYPGWVATIDGVPTRIFRTNYVLRGLLIPKGDHVVSLQYKPRSFVLGAGISIISFVLIMILCIAAYFLGRKNHKIV